MLKYVGRLAKNKSVLDLARKHDVSVDIIRKALDAGTKVELEHTKDQAVARKIAMDHVLEDPEYYTKLKKIEEEAPVNSVGAGGIAGIAPGDIAPVRPKKDYRKLLRRLLARRKE
jgi:hypothetical protein